MAEKLFIISEVKPAYEDRIVRQGEHNQYKLADGRGVLWLPDDAVIPASRLRYASSVYLKDRLFFTDSGWGDESSTDSDLTHRFLVLSPPDPADEWEKWVEEIPTFPRDSIETIVPDAKDIKAWLRRMPRGK